VKICSLYGVGYYYIPGTDTCIKIGGYVRYEAYQNEPQGSPGYASNFGAPLNNIGVFTRNSNTWAQQARFRLTGDVRSQTEYGTLRAYFAFGINFSNGTFDPNPGNVYQVAMERAFIQFAGFTIGRSDTFFAFYNGAAYGLVPMFLDGGSGPAGHNVFAYTWQFGNGLSATLSAEDASGLLALRSKPVIDVDGGAGPNGNNSLYGASDAAGQRVPDLVGNLRVDQAWGSAQIMGGLHQVRGRYHAELLAANNGATLQGCTTDPVAGVAQANTTNCSYANDEWGWAVGGGLTLKMPWDAKDTLSGVIAYGKGATGFVAYGGNSSLLHKQDVATGALVDAVYGSPGRAGLNGQLELTEAWGGTVAFEHYWTPSLRTSLVFGYLDVSYNDNAKALIRSNGCTGGTGTGGVFASQAGSLNCDPDWSLWRLASRTMWNPVENLDVGVEIAYTKVNTAWAGVGDVAAVSGLARGLYNIDDQNVWSAAIRVQRSFWP